MTSFYQKLLKSRTSYVSFLCMPHDTFKSSHIVCLWTMILLRPIVLVIKVQKVINYHPSQEDFNTKSLS
ncbi:hypothetical protein EUGRSUZ_C02710 [Eucalyptus grandis]|uniref:Uncharacterized protein n=2 Tax=Eucalyptus grandis TaxID=71139 RepID=A0ACC3LGG6_EUCGR|nr:hypothetical protein EUGRSUZ_C02710 [Eucalyptus grandis]